MKIHNIDPANHTEQLSINNAVVTSGTFDGLHKGHQVILQRLKEKARAKGGESVVLTYWPHPRLVLNPQDDSLRLLSTWQEKEKLMGHYGVDHLVKVHFTKTFSQFSSDKFIRHILINTLNTQSLVIGYDHKFGKNREGSFEYLQANQQYYGFDVEEIPPQEIDDCKISSSQIRKALLSGNIHEATQFLGHYYSLQGKVVKGDQLGRELGFPTANIEPDDAYKLVPEDGIYSVLVSVEDTILKGMMYIGYRPTINGTKRSLEVNIFDFDQNIYDTTIKVFFVEQIRKEAKQENLDDLKQQLFKDRESTLESLKTSDLKLLATH